MPKENIKIKALVLIKEYTKSMKLGTFEPITTGELERYPDLWQHVFEECITIPDDLTAIEKNIYNLFEHLAKM